MDERTFVRTLDLCAEYGQTPYIGGGEPTVHPQFWQFLGLILGRAHEYDLEMLGMHTNGKRTNDALALATLARRGVLGVTLSTDSYHEPIDPEVLKAFTGKGRTGDHWATSERRDPHDLRGTANGADRQIVAMGRGKRITGARRDYCVCEDLQVDPDGRIWACGCKRTQFGTVWDPHLPDNAFEMACWERKVAEEEKVRGFSSDLLEMEVTGRAGDVLV